MRAKKKTKPELDPTDIDFALEALAMYGVKEGRGKAVRDRVDTVLKKYRTYRKFIYGSTLLENLRQISMQRIQIRMDKESLESALSSILEATSVISFGVDPEEFTRAEAFALVATLKSNFGFDASYDETVSAMENCDRLRNIEYYECKKMVPHAKHI